MMKVILFRCLPPPKAAKPGKGARLNQEDHHLVFIIVLFIAQVRSIPTDDKEDAAAEWGVLSGRATWPNECFANWT